MKSNINVRGEVNHSCLTAEHVEMDFPLRVLLYSHDSVGLGHLRRNLAIARQINATFPNASILIVTGSPCATQFPLPANTDMVKIPSISKDDKGCYVPLDRSMSLDETLAFRSEIILDTYRLFKPTLIIVDHQLTGLKGEALNMLREAKRRGVLTIYGSRDIKDHPDVVVANWSKPESQWALRNGYDRICVYGMRDVFDPRVSYKPCLESVDHIEFTGFLVPPNKPQERVPSPRERKKVLVIFGGGGDGMERARRYLQALKLKPVPWDSHIITGPLMDKSIKRDLRRLAQTTEPIGAVKLQSFHRSLPALMQQADAIVSMAGYNSCMEILQSGVPAVLLPRSFPRQEQLMRARLFAQRGWVRHLENEELNPQDIRNAVETALASPGRAKSEADLNGLNRLMEIIVELLCHANLVNAGTYVDKPISSAG